MVSCLKSPRVIHTPSDKTPSIETVPASKWHLPYTSMHMLWLAGTVGSHGSQTIAQDTIYIPDAPPSSHHAEMDKKDVSSCKDYGQQWF